VWDLMIHAGPRAFSPALTDRGQPTAEMGRAGGRIGWPRICRTNPMGLVSNIAFSRWRRKPPSVAPPP